MQLMRKGEGSRWSLIDPICFYFTLSCLPNLLVLGCKILVLTSLSTSAKDKVLERNKARLSKMREFGEAKIFKNSSEEPLCGI